MLRQPASHPIHPASPATQPAWHPCIQPASQPASQCRGSSHSAAVSIALSAAQRAGAGLAPRTAVRGLHQGRYRGQCISFCAHRTTVRRRSTATAGRGADRRESANSVVDASKWTSALRVRCPPTCAPGDVWPFLLYRPGRADFGEVLQAVAGLHPVQDQPGDGNTVMLRHKSWGFWSCQILHIFQI